MAPRIQSLELARYRGFRDAQRAELLRLNLVYGENNAGKSAFVRLPALLAASRTPGRAGLVLGEPVRWAGFKEVQWRGPLPDEADPDLVLGVGLSDGGATWRWTFRWVDSSSTSVIQRIELDAGEEHAAFEPPKGLVFDGIIPRSGAHALLDRHRDGLAGALDGVIWLEAKREGPTREGMPRGAQGAFTSKGEGAAALVAADPHLLRAVSAWFQEHTQHTVEAVSLASEMQRLILRPSGEAYDRPFPDAGEGLQQVFPVVAALEHLRRDGGLLCVEEPESHLHPRLEKALAGLISEVLVAQPAASVLLETHSEVFLIAALQAAVTGLRGEVRLFWVEAGKEGAATLDDIALDGEGRPTTPRMEQAFATMGVMQRELFQARKSRPRAG